MSFRPAPSAIAPAGESFREVRRRVEALKRWGLGWGEEPEGYRQRLRDLCRFLQAVKGGADEPIEGDSARIRSAVDKVNREPDEPERKARFRRLRELAPILGGLIAERERLRELAPILGGLTECERLREQAGRAEVRAWLQRLATWSPRPRTGETLADFDRRYASLKGPLELVGILAVSDFGPPEERPLDHLLGLAEELCALQATTPADDLNASWDRLRELLDDCLADWEWAYVQVQVEIARLHEKKAPKTGAEVRAELGKAYDLLTDALARLESGGFRQLQTQGLYGRLAQVCLRRVAAGDDPMLLQVALGHAYRGVELDPEAAPARLVLIEALAALGDYDTLRVEAEVACDLDPGPETFKVTGATYWQRAAALRDRGPRRQVLAEAALFFEEALGSLESAAFDHEAPLRLMEAHGWAHFWLGRFQMERARHDDAIAHLRIACRLGFKPLESRVELAWACLLARDPHQAERAFIEAAKEIQRARTGSRVSPALGEEREIDELDFDARLGWALFSAEWAPTRIGERLQAARELLETLSRSGKENLEAALSEAQGRAYFRADDFAAAIAELKRTVEMSPRPGAYCYLGLAEAEMAREKAKEERETALRHARRACDLAQKTDVRERHQREIDELDAAIKQLGAAPVVGGDDQVPGAPGGAAEPATPGPGATSPGSGAASPGPEATSPGSGEIAPKSGATR